MGGSSGLGAITDFVGLTDYSGAENRQDAATQAIKSGTDASVAMFRENIKFQTEQLDYQKEQYQDWKSIYGDLQQNIGDYYKNLSGDTLASKQLQAQATEYSMAQKEVTQQLAQRGISGSGLEAASQVAMGMQGAGQRAQIRAGAEDMATKEKMAFLGLGLGQGTQMLGQQVAQASNVGQGYTGAGNAQLQGAISQGNIQSAYAQGTQTGSYAMGKDLMNKSIDIGGKVLGGYMAGSDARFKNNLKLEDTIKGINFYSWDWNDLAISLNIDVNEPYGVIAQEIIGNYPQFIIMLDNSYYAVDYEALYKYIGDN
jgi:hypothetical protein